MKTRIKWVGFDMDECLGTLYPLYAYCEELMNRIQDDAIRNQFYIDMIDVLSDQIFIQKNHNLWIFRPQFEHVLDVLIDAFKYGQITGCFILSNNGSKSLVATAQLLLNAAIAKKTHHQITNLFQAAWSANSPCRSGLVKSWTVVQTCLKHAGLPTMLDPKTDLLFYDDKVHPSLKKELGPNYIQVSPYFNYTPHQHVYSILKPLFDKYKFSQTFRQQFKQYAEQIEKEDMDLIFDDTPGKVESYSLRTPSPKIRQQISEFLEPLFRFLAASPRKTKPIQPAQSKTLKTAKTASLGIKRTPHFKTSIRRKNRRDPLWSRY